MEYSKDLIIPSDSGYCFPFVALEGNPVSVILDYGEQINPSTGQKFNHTGIDFSVSKGSPLYALADGMVTGIGDDDVHGHTITARYGNFYVIYGHVSECLREYGERVRARDVIARSGSFVHLGVLYKGEVIDPKEFIDLIAANINELESLGEMMHSDKQNPTNTEYDQFSDEISVLFVRYFPSYMSALRTGTYRPSETFEEKMRSLFVSSASQNYFYEKAAYRRQSFGTHRPCRSLGRKGSGPPYHRLPSLCRSDASYLYFRLDRRAKKAVLQGDGGQLLTVDPLKELQTDIQSFDISHRAFLYYNQSGDRVWTKGYFNNRPKGEKSVEVTQTWPSNLHRVR